MKKVISVLLCIAILLAYGSFNGFANEGKIVVEEVKYSNAEQVSVDDVKQAIKSNSLAGYGDKDKFINAQTEDGKKFGNLVDITLTKMKAFDTSDYHYIIFDGQSIADPDVLYAAVSEKALDGTGDEKLTVYPGKLNTGKANVNEYFFNFQKVAEIISTSGIGKPYSFDILTFGLKINTNKGEFVYTIQELTDTYGEKIKDDYYYLKSNAVYTYSDYLKWENKKQANYELWLKYVDTKPVTQINEDGESVTTIPSETANPSPTPDDNKEQESEDKTAEDTKTEDSQAGSYQPIITFSDISSNHPLYNMLSTLAALNIISGYEDGTFKKDELVTRAETTKMILSSISPDDSAQAKRAQGLIGSGYSDVPRGHWVASYLNIATDKFGFIQGYGNGMFAPESHVTYAEAVKMLVCCLGYEERAAAVGGWPSGYLSIAAEIGVTKNISFQADVAVTRGDLAQLIYNALNTPILYAITFDKRTDVNGVETLEREYVIMNEENNRGVSQTMLTWYQRAYVVKGIILSVSGKDVKIRIDESDNFNFKKITSQNPRTETFKNGLNEISPLIDQTVYALVQMRDDNLTIIQIQPVND